MLSTVAHPPAVQEIASSLPNQVKPGQTQYFEIDTALRIIKLTEFPVPVRFRCGSGY